MSERRDQSGPSRRRTVLVVAVTLATVAAFSVAVPGGAVGAAPSSVDAGGASESSTAVGVDGESGRTANETDESAAFVDVPPGFEVEVYASGADLGGSEEFNPGPRPGPRLMRMHEGTLFVSVPNEKRDEDAILALPDDDGDGQPDRTVTVLESPTISDAHGFDFANGRIYVVNHDDGPKNDVVSYEMDGVTADESTERVLVSDLPDRGGGVHWTRTLEIHDGGMYISAGTKGNIYEDENEWRAAITRCDLDGSDCTTFADGLRNVVGMTVHDGRLIVTDNAGGDLGDEGPPDELNVVERGNHYGYPYCYGDNEPHPEFDEPERCEDKAPPAETFPAHSAPLGIDFPSDQTADSSFPAEYRGDAFVAHHGSWNADPPQGYEIVRVPYENGSFGEPTTFATGWYESDGDDDLYEKGEDVLGRPVDVLVAPDGDMYVSDDSSGRIYRIWYDETDDPCPTPVAEGLSSPTDPDGDGRCEDVNGNDRLDFGDVVALFQQFQSDPVRDTPDAFDFNDNGRLDFDDIVTLFRTVAGA
jgi:glucose/arabinose dehydrogenase